jgi:hypothetical protein
MYLIEMLRVVVPFHPLQKLEVVLETAFHQLGHVDRLAMERDEVFASDSARREEVSKEKRPWESFPT